MSVFHLGNIFGNWARTSDCAVLQAWLAKDSWELVRDLGTLVSQLRAARNNTNPKRIAPTAILRGEIFLGDNVVIGDCSLIRGPAVILDGSIVGHASEIIESFVGPKSRLSHKVTVGHSILGRNVNVGASVTVASVLMTNDDMDNLSKRVHILLGPDEQELIDTGLMKFGATIGDDASLGPGVIIGPRTFVSPNMFVRSNVYGPDAKVVNPAYEGGFSQEFRYWGMEKYATLVERVFAAYRTLREDGILDRTGGR